MKQIIAIVFVIFAVISLIALTFTLNQINQEANRLEADIQYRSSLLADGLKETVEPNFINKSDPYLQSLVERYANDQRVAGLAIVDNKGAIVAVSSSLSKEISQPQKSAADAMDADKPNGNFETISGEKMYIFATPLHDKKSVVGSLIVVQHASYIDSRLFDIWTGNIIRLITQALMISLAVLLILRWVIYQPTKNLVEALRSTRRGDPEKNGKDISPSSFFFKNLVNEISSVRTSLIDARSAASEEARLRMERLDSPWTAHRLKEYGKDILGDRTIVVVSNREPYVHTKNGDKITHYIPASGMVTAIEPLMKSCGGIWVAHGSGTGDKQSVDQKDHVNVPPDEPKYTLRRVWLTEEEENGYYLGLSNEGLWPLCHIAHVRPVFRKEDWLEYKKVNAKFAEAVLSEIKNKDKPIVFIQDFQLALVPKMVKHARPDATIGIFWHVPWPNEETFRICPWKKEILDGILGADLIGFHIQTFCNNFIETVGRELESLIDLEQFSIKRANHTSYVKPFPVSIPFPNGPTPNDSEIKQLAKNLNIKTKYIGIGVDRLDYTKGLLEKIKGIELFLKKYPEYLEHFTFVQLAAPSKSKIETYQNFVEKVDKETERVNSLYKRKGWKPIILLKKHHNQKDINKFYKLGNFCLVTSLHDGMNLVAKEFIGAKDDGKGVLILSQFAGASKELRDALIINPYDAQETADSIKQALEMPIMEQVTRMENLRGIVKGYNIYRWSADILENMATLT